MEKNHTFSKMEANSHDLHEFLTKHFPFDQKYFLFYIIFQSFSIFANISKDLQETKINFKK